MQTIVIIGDSWAAPPGEGQEIPGRYTQQGHCSQLFGDLGYRVENRAIRGGSNLESWQRAREFTEPGAAWIIWFHTELGRDWCLRPPVRPWQMQTKLEQVSRRVYSEIRDHLAYLAPTRGLILVEGQSVRALPWFTEYLQPQILIRDWRSELVGEPCPESQIFGALITNPDFLDHCVNTAEVKQHWLDQATEILDQMKRHPDLFPDLCHPGDYAMAQLTLRLHTAMRAYG